MLHYDRSDLETICNLNMCIEKQKKKVRMKYFLDNREVVIISLPIQESYSYLFFAVPFAALLLFGFGTTTISYQCTYYLFIIL